MKALRQYHPAVGFCFFLLMIILSLASMHPVFQCVSFVAVVGYGIAASGARAFIRGTWWVILLIIVVMLFNGLFVGGSGLSILFTFNIGIIRTTVSVESLVYGAVMGTMLANVILWFNVLGKVSSMQGFIELFTKISPAMGMMIARITVFIPELIAHARLVNRAQRAFSGGDRGTVLLGRQGDGSLVSFYLPRRQKETREPSPCLPKRTVPLSPARRSQLAYGAELSSHLMEWGMEKSLITANSMMARGYGSRKRTSYRRTRVTLRDIVPLVAILILGVTSLVCAIWGGMEYRYYPYLAEITLWWGYVPLLLLSLVPLILQCGEELAWWRSR